MGERTRRFLAMVLIGGLGTVVALGLVEAGVRLVRGGPSGRFLGWFPGDGGLYPPSASLRMPGPIPYVATTNALGFRGPEWTRSKPDGLVRIAALGDSITDGFFVENDNGYPAMLQDILAAQGFRVDVLNAAHGGGSIDKELAILRDRVVPFDPDVVVLTFVTNDLFEISGRTREELVSRSVSGPALRERLLRFVLTRSSAGEWFWDRFLVLRSPTYGSSKAMEGRAPAERYRIEGGDRFRENAELFLKRFARRDARILRSPLDAEARELADNYVYALATLHDDCRERSIDLVLVYFPSYPEIYGAAVPQPVRDLLREACASRSIPFLDLTDAFRRAGDGRVLHLAPVDFHPNPEGNRVIAETVADFLARGVLSAHAGLETGSKPIR